MRFNVRGFLYGRQLLSRIAIVSVSLLSLALPSLASGIAEQINMSSEVKCPSQLSIPVTLKPGEASIQFPAIKKQEGKVPCIRFRATLVTKKPAGWQHYLSLDLNGTPLQQRTADGSNRLMNRGEWLKSDKAGNSPWWGGEDGRRLVTFFGPEAGELDSRLTSPREEGYWYLLDISDHANYLTIGVDNRVENAKPNILIFRNNYTTLTTGETADCREMKISDISIGFVSTKDLSPYRTTGVREYPKSLAGLTLKSKESNLTLAKSGALFLNIAGDTYLFGSDFSYPSKIKGYHHFSWKKDPDSGWTVRMVDGKVIGECSEYRITRSVRKEDGKYKVFDTIENKTSNPIGLEVHHKLDATKMPAPGETYLAGQCDINYVACAPTNPSIYLQQPKSSLGVVVEDNVSRVQLFLLRTQSQFQYGTDHFGLKPHAKYTMEWTLYPSKTRDYFNFVNKVRKDWKVNVTIPGGFVYALGVDIVPGRKIKLYAQEPWFAYSTGADLGWDGYIKYQKPVLAGIYKAQPDAVTLAELETNLVAIRRTDIPNGQNIPVMNEEDGRPGKYGQEVNKEWTQALKDAPATSKWWDSMLKTGDGRAIIDTYYADKAFIDLMVYPVPGNYQTQYMMKQIDCAMDQIGFRGVYIDQFTLRGVTLASPDRCDYSKWDGYTVDLDDSGKISKKYTDACLVGIPAREQIVKHVLQKHGVLVVNGHCVDRETRSLPFVRFAETEWTPWDPVEHLYDEPPTIDAMGEANLDTPVMLGIRPERFPSEVRDPHYTEIIQKWIIASLKNGGLYYYYASKLPTSGPGAGDYGITNHMFPFTPVELHAGWLIGKERILTAKSGTFVWSHPEKPVCLVFDLKGKPVKPNVKMTKENKQWHITLKLEDWNQTAVIETAADAKLNSAL